MGNDRGWRVRGGKAGRWTGRCLPLAFFCLVVGGCGATGSNADGGGTSVTAMRGQEYWDNLSAYKGRPRYDYPGPSLIGGTGGGP